MNQPIEEKWQEEFEKRWKWNDSGQGTEIAVVSKHQFYPWLENLLEQERRRTVKEPGYCEKNGHHYDGGEHPFGKREQSICITCCKEEPTTPEKCPGKYCVYSSVPTCPFDGSFHEVTPEKLPTSSYEVTCGRCEKSIKHSC